MNKRMFAALIVTGSADLEHGLGALLESLPDVTTVTVIKEETLAFAWIESHRPAIVLLDPDLSRKDPCDFFESVRAVSPETRRVLLINDLQSVSDRTPNCAEILLLKGVAPSSVVATITNLLSAKGQENEYISSKD